jgi:hypothetical protein
VSVPAQAELNISMSVDCWGFGEIRGIQVEEAPAETTGGAYIALQS